MSLVLDSSAALAWIYDDETTDPIRLVFNVVVEHGAFVPSLWRLEIANSLTGAFAAGGSTVNSAVRRWPISVTSTLSWTLKRIREPGMQRSNLAIVSACRSMTPLMSSSRRGGSCRWPLSTATCKEPPPSSA